MNSEEMRPRQHTTSVAMLLAIAIVGFAGCGDDGGSPTGPTTPVKPVVDTQSDEEAARQAADAWLALLDAGNYSEAYAATGSFFQESVTVEEFLSTMDQHDGRAPSDPGRCRVPCPEHHETADDGA